MFRSLTSALLASCVLAQAPTNALSAAAPTDVEAYAAAPTYVAATRDVVTVEKTYERAFDVEDAGNIRLDNRHGDIDYFVSDDGQVRISVLVTASAASERKAQALLDKVDVDIEGSRSEVSAKTRVGKSGGNVSIVTRNGDTRRGFEVDYKVYAPPGFRLSLKNSFGDVRLPDLTAAADIEVGYGDLEAHDLGAGSSLDIGFGNASVGYAPDLNAKVKYGELHLAGAETAKVHARFSELELGRFGSLEMDSQYGEYTIQSAGSFRNEGGFNDLRIDSAERLSLEGGYNDVRVGYLAESGDFDVRFGEVHVASTSPRLTALTFKGNYTDLTAVLADGLAYTLDAETSYGDIHYPKALVTSKEISKGSSDRIEGKVGDGQQAMVKLEGSFGDLVIK